MKALVLLLVVIYCSTVTSAARILLLLPFPGKSHHIFTTAITKALVQRGHHVVEFSPYPPVAPIPNHTHFSLHTRFEKEIASWNYEDFVNHPAVYEHDIYGFKVRRIWEMTQSVCEDTFSDKNIKQLLSSKEKFDLVMTESTFGQESLLVFGHRFAAPVVCLETFIPWIILNWISGNSLSSASVPDLMAKTFDSEVMSLKEKTFNSISIFLTLVGFYQWHLPFHENLVRQHFPQPDTPSVYSMVNNISLFLTNSHPSAVNYIQPYTPNVIPVGGLHITPGESKLPTDIQNFLDNSKNGFIYLSFGTVVPLHVFPRDVLQIFINVFKKLPQKVLWKISLDNLDNLPPNVKLAKWVPQLGVLEHPNCQLFITHGGLFSHHEAIYSGVPTVGIPFFADQSNNVQYSSIKGRGVKLDFDNLTEESLYDAISTVLKNPRYMNAAKTLSRVYRDRPVSAKDTAVFWIEYVLRHGGSSLRPASLNLSWYQLALLDVIGLVLAVGFLALTFLYVTVKFLLSFICPSRSKNKTNIAKKKN